MQDDEARARHAEIARRYARKNRRGDLPRPFSMAALRIAEINRVLVDNFRGEHLPDDDAGRDDAMLAVHHLAKLARDPARRIHSWLRTWAPWMPEDEAAELASKAMAKPMRWKADTLAAKLGVTAEQRTRLKLRTIGAIDQTKAERQVLQRERRRAAATARRRANGAKPRAEYLRQRRERAKNRDTDETTARPSIGPCPI